jgi:hypothetical protein
LKSFFFPHASRFNSFQLHPNPSAAMIGEEMLVLGHSGQAIQDIALQSSSELSTTTNGAAAAEVNTEEEENYPIDILRRSFFWGNIFPTCPGSSNNLDSIAASCNPDDDGYEIDTLPCYPFKSHDPFLLKVDDRRSIPKILFAGNQVSSSIYMYLIKPTV